MDLYEALYTTRAMRRVAPESVPEDVIKLMLDAAIRAPSGSNMQNWRWLVVTDHDTIARIGELYREAYKHLNETVYAGADRSDPSVARIVRSSDWLAENFDSVPLVVFPYHRNDPSGASIYPAVWNMMLAARGQGIGATLTTILGWFREEQLAEVLGVPLEKGWKNAAAVTCGYPLGRWGLAVREPADQVVFQDRWDAAPSWTVPEPLWSDE